MDRAAIEDVCGTSSAANQFLHNAINDGLLVPVAWGAHQVVDKATYDVVARVANRAFRRFISWARILPAHTPSAPLFWAPRLWRDTRLNVTHPMPVLALDENATVAEGTPPQWKAFQSDVVQRERWLLLLDGDSVAAFESPGIVDTILMARATLNERWRAAASDLEKDLAAADRRLLGHLWAKLEPPTTAPTGKKRLRVGTGPPFRHRLLAPRWYMDLVRAGVKQHAFGAAVHAA